MSENKRSNPDSGFFRTAPFGYDKKDVIAYVDSLKRRLISLQEDTKYSMKDLQKQLDNERSAKLSVIQQNETLTLRLRELEKQLLENQAEQEQSRQILNDADQIVESAKKQREQILAESEEVRKEAEITRKAAEDIRQKAEQSIQNTKNILQQLEQSILLAKQAIGASFDEVEQTAVLEEMPQDDRDIPVEPTEQEQQEDGADLQSDIDIHDEDDDELTALDELSQTEDAETSEEQALLDGAFLIKPEMYAGYEQYTSRVQDDDQTPAQVTEETNGFNVQSEVAILDEQPPAQINEDTNGFNVQSEVAVLDEQIPAQIYEDTNGFILQNETAVSDKQIPDQTHEETNNFIVQNEVVVTDEETDNRNDQNFYAITQSDLLTEEELTSFSFTSDPEQQEEVYDLVSELIQPVETSDGKFAFEEQKANLEQSEEMLQFIPPKPFEPDLLLQEENTTQRNIGNYL